MLDIIKPCILCLLPLLSTASSPKSAPDAATSYSVLPIAQPTPLQNVQDAPQAVAMVTALPTTPWIAKRQVNSLAGYALIGDSYVGIYCSTTASWLLSSTYAGCCPSTACNAATACANSIVRFSGGGTSACISNACVTHIWRYSSGAPAYVNYGCNTGYGDMIYNKPTLAGPAPGTTTVKVTVPTTSTVPSTVTMPTTVPTTVVNNNNSPTANNSPAANNDKQSPSTQQPSTVTVVTSSTSYATNAAGSTSTAIVVYTTSSVVALSNSNSNSGDAGDAVNKQNSSNMGAIIGGAVGGGLGVLVIAAAALFFCCYKRKQSQKRASSEDNTPSTIYVNPRPKIPDLPYPPTNFPQPPAMQPVWTPQTRPSPPPGGYYQNAGQASPAGFAYAGNNSPPPVYGRSPSELSGGNSPRISGYTAAHQPVAGWTNGYGDVPQEMSATSLGPPQGRW